ncbi:transcriptional regulator, partial [Streptomyces sp. NPDC058964]|uniref:transcriptional regulator n=1 Tax=Streptomyces sp. NPDC058964 TaxID=3346681 RepID=UPI003679E120
GRGARAGGPRPARVGAALSPRRRPFPGHPHPGPRDAGLVSERRSGRQRIYRLEAAPLAEVQDWLHPYERFWRDRLKGLGELLDRMPDDDPS